MVGICNTVLEWSGKRLGPLAIQVLQLEDVLSKLWLEYACNTVLEWSRKRLGPLATQDLQLEDVLGKFSTLHSNILFENAEICI